MIRKTTFLAAILLLAIPSILQANPADIYPTGKVDMVDFVFFAAAWLSNDSPTANWDPDCDIADANSISDPNYSVIDERDLAVLAANWLWTGLDEMGWVYIDDSGAGMKDRDGNPISHGGFTGEMSKYETTNAQYCQFLNAALASGDITVNGDLVEGANGSNSGEDFVGNRYFRLYGQIEYQNGTFVIITRDGYDMSNHPVVDVSWYGATAFCNYYGFWLPTEWEWQAVADYDGSFIYGCGPTLGPSMANHYVCPGHANPLNLTRTPYTSPVDYYPAYGYGMCDMAGNAWELTSSCYFADCLPVGCAIRGGCWDGEDYNCPVEYKVSYRIHCGLDSLTPYVGFRVCR